MKKKLLFAAMLLGLMSYANAQTNIQEMWDYNRAQLTTTIEMFKADDWGSTFFFTDIYHKTSVSTPTDFYTEIARSLNFWKDSKLAPLSLHVEWNGGCGIFGLPGYDNWGGYQVKNAWLFGIEYFLHNADYTNTFTFELMYKCFSGQQAMNDRPSHINAIVASVPAIYPYTKVSDIPIQFTFVWGMQNIFGVKGLTFSGFLDVWGENACWNADYDGDLVKISLAKELNQTTDVSWDVTKLVVLTEPQIWYNLGQHFNCPNLNVGGEVEMAYNFTGGYKGGVANKGFTVAPALGVKWNF